MNKKPYDIKLDVLIPTTITYRINATSEQEAIRELEKQSAPVKIALKYNTHKQIKLKATVYSAGTSMIKFSKVYRTL